MSSKSTYNLRVDEKLKRSFLNATNEQGINGSEVLRVFMLLYSKKPDVFSLDFDSWVDTLLARPAVKEKFSSLGKKLECKGL